MHCMCVGGAYSEDLRGDVVWSTHGSGARDFPSGVHLQTGAKVGQSDVTIFVDENIVWFDVSEEERNS